MIATYRETYFLSAGESNAEHEMSLPLLVAKMIDIATAHANSLGIGNPAMEDINAGWVLSRLTIEMEKYPSVNDSYVLSTWVESFNRHFSVRSFKISSPEGHVYGYARSIWMVMDTVNHTNVGLAHLSLPEDAISGEVAPISKQAKHFTIVEENAASELPAGTLISNRPSFDYKFKYCDLDFYRHVNTVRYVTLLLNRFSLEDYDECFVKRLELSFLHEAKYGMETRLLRHDNPDNNLLTSFLLTNKEDATPLLFARLLRCPRS